MKLYLCSYRIPVPNALFELVGKKPKDISVAIIPNAKDYYADRARAVKIRDSTEYLQGFGLSTQVVNLHDYSNETDVTAALEGHDLVWVMGGNTFCLRHEMHRSGFDAAIGSLLEAGLVYAGESAGAVVAGTSLAGIEKADNPEFAESIIQEGLSLVPYFVLPHVDNVNFVEDVAESRRLHPNAATRIELKDSEAAIFDGGSFRVVEGAVKE